jgi:hypothetical protein
MATFYNYLRLPPKGAVRRVNSTSPPTQKTPTTVSQEPIRFMTLVCASLRVICGVIRGQFKDLKTSEVRDMDLVDRVISTLEAQMQFTYMKRAEIFENPVTGRPWHDERSQRDHY